MEYNDLVSIVLPVHNAQATLSRCVESLTGQTYKNIEIIAIDDKSTDESFKILKDFSKKDKRIHVFKNKKRYGLAICFNRALRCAKGKFIAFMDPRDRSLQQRIESQVLYLVENPDVVAVGAQCTFLNKHDRCVGKSSNPLEHESIYQRLLTATSLQFETAMINLSLLPKDLLKFTENAYPFVYANVFVKLINYGKLANLAAYLHFHQISSHSHHKKLTTTNRIFSHMLLWYKSITLYDYRPSLRSFSIFIPN